MLLRNNELGWRLHKCMLGFAIKRARPSLRSRLGQIGPAFVNVLLVVALWLGRGMVLLIVCAAMVLLLLAWLTASERAKRAAWLTFLSLGIFLGLLAGANEINADLVLYAIPLSLLGGLWFLRPIVLYGNVRARVVGDCFGHSVPFARLSIELHQDEESGRYRVSLKDTELLSETTTQDGIWKCLVWESTTEAEASAVADELRAWGIGSCDSCGQGQMVKGDRRLRILALSGYILAVTLLILLLMWISHSGEKSLQEGEPEVVLRVAQIVIAFLFLSVLPFATYLWWLGRLSIRYRQMPPQGMRTIMDMKVLNGDEAVARGRAVRRVAFVLAMVALIGGLYIPYKLGRILGVLEERGQSPISDKKTP